MKKCPRCEQELDLSLFSKRKDGGYSSYCKQCSNAAAKESYRKNPNNVKNIADRSYTIFKVIINDIKVKYGCSFCDEKTAICLDFHHLDQNEKDLDVSSFVKRKRKKETFEEMNKCIVVCSNCHRKIHANLLSTDGKIPCNENVYDYFEPIGDRLPLKKDLRDKFFDKRKVNHNLQCRCGKPKNRKSVKCQECDNISKSLTSKCPAKEILAGDMVECNSNVTAMAKKYNVSHTTMRKWLIKNNIPW